MVLSGETSEQNILVGDPGVRHWGGMGAVSGDDRKRMKEGRPRRPRSLTPMRARMISHISCHIPKTAILMNKKVDFFLLITNQRDW